MKLNPRVGALLSVLALCASVLVAGTIAAVPAASSSVSYEDCQAALGYPDRTEADVAWLNDCVHALRPYVAPTPTATPEATATPTPTASGPGPITTTTTTAPVTPTPTPALPLRYQVNGRWLYDPAGYRVIPRGVEQNFSTQGWLPNSVATEIGRTGANAIRILPHYTQGAGPNTIAQIEDQIKRGVNAKMMVDVAIDGGRDSAVFLRPEVKALLLKYQRYIVIHAKGESYESTEAAWVTASNAVIDSLRGAGITSPLYIMANQGGRNLPTLLHRAADVEAHDPLHNVVFGWQAYWGSNNAYQNQYACPTSPCTLTMALQAAAAATVPIQLGLIYRSDPQDNSSQVTPVSALMQQANELQLGWLWWDGRQGIDNLSFDGIMADGHWATPGMNGPCSSPCQPNLALGKMVAIDDPGSIQKTAIRSPWLLAQSV